MFFNEPMIWIPWKDHSGFLLFSCSTHTHANYFKMGIPRAIIKTTMADKLLQWDDPEADG